MSVEKSSEVIKQWTIAIKMRRWLLQKKQNIAEKISKMEISDENVKTNKE